MKKVFVLMLSSIFTIMILSISFNNNVSAQVNSNGVKYYKSIKNLQNFKLIKEQKVKKSDVTVSNAKWVYSKNLYYAYKIGDGSFFETTTANEHKVLAKRIFYNKLEHQYYTFYKLNNPGSKNTFWVRDKWVIFSNQNNMKKQYNQIISLFKNYDNDNVLQYLAFNYASFVDNPLLPDGMDDGNYVAYGDLVNNVIENSRVDFFELNANKNVFSKKLFSKLQSHKITFKNYVNKLFNNQIGNLDKYGENKKIGLFIYPKGTYKYGNIIFVITDKNIKVNKSYML